MTSSSFWPLRSLILGLLMLSAASASAAVAECAESAECPLWDQWHSITTEFSQCVNNPAKPSSPLLPLTFPPCLMRTLTSSSAIAFTIAILYALLARQSFLGFRSEARWALVMAAISLLALAFLGETLDSALAGDFLPFLGLIALSLLFGGLVVYWARFLLALIPVVVVAFAYFVRVDELDELVGLSIGVVGGAWLYWWCDWRDSRRPVVPAKDDAEDRKDKPNAIVDSA